MCRRHWFLVPGDLQREVYANYRDGQCEDKRPSSEWHDAASAAIGYVALLDGHTTTLNEVKALVQFGHAAFVEDMYVKRMGEDKRAHIKKLLAI